MSVEKFISTVPLFVVGLAALISLVSFRDNYPAPLKKLSVLWIINFFTDLAGHITKNLGLRNHWIYNIYFWIMYLSLAYLYDTQIVNKNVRKSIRWFYVVFPVFVFIETWINGIYSLQTQTIVVGGIFMIFLTMAYFRQIYLSDESDLITHDPWFWFSCGFTIHFGGTVPFLGMLNYLWRVDKAFTHFYYLYLSNTFTILLNILIIVGFLCRRNYQKSR